MEALSDLAHSKLVTKLHRDCPTSIIRVLCRVKSVITAHEQLTERRRSKSNRHHLEIEIRVPKNLTRVSVSSIKDKDLFTRAFLRTFFFEGLIFFSSKNH